MTKFCFPIAIWKYSFIFLASFLLIFIAGCSDETDDITTPYIPDELTNSTWETIQDPRYYYGAFFLYPRKENTREIKVKGQICFQSSPNRYRS